MKSVRNEQGFALVFATLMIVLLLIMVGMGLDTGHLAYVRSQGQPAVEINLTLGAEPIADGMYEVTVMATVTTKVNDKTLFLVEAKQGGIFEIRNIPEEQLKQILGIACPNIVYPYLRAIVSDVCTRAGFPPVVLSEVNFQAMYEAQQAQANAQIGGAASNGSGIAGTVN